MDVLGTGKRTSSSIGDVDRSCSNPKSSAESRGEEDSGDAHDALNRVENQIKMSDGQLWGAKSNTKWKPREKKVSTQNEPHRWIRPPARHHHSSHTRYTSYVSPSSGLDSRSTATSECSRIVGCARRFQLWLNRQNTRTHPCRFLAFSTSTLNASTCESSIEISVPAAAAAAARKSISDCLGCIKPIGRCREP